jgi:hypothetical protein
MGGEIVIFSPRTDVGLCRDSLDRDLYLCMPRNVLIIRSIGGYKFVKVTSDRSVKEDHPTYQVAFGSLGASYQTCAQTTQVWRPASSNFTPGLVASHPDPSNAANDFGT